MVVLAVIGILGSVSVARFVQRAPSTSASGGEGEL
jgi:multisubunit Na+/H+ antiporter MnhF subunit